MARVWRRTVVVVLVTLASLGLVSVGLYVRLVLDEGPLELGDWATACVGHSSDGSYYFIHAPLDAPRSIGGIHLVSASLIDSPSMQVRDAHFSPWLRDHADGAYLIMEVGVDWPDTNKGGATSALTAAGIQVDYRSGWRLYRERRHLDIRMPDEVPVCR